MERDLESLKIKFIQEVLSEQSYDALQVWLDMHEEARYAASISSNEPELIKFKEDYERSVYEGLHFSNKPQKEE